VFPNNNLVCCVHWCSRATTNCTVRGRSSESVGRFHMSSTGEATKRSCRGRIYRGRSSTAVSPKLSKPTTSRATTQFAVRGRSSASKGTSKSATEKPTVRGRPTAPSRNWVKADLNSQLPDWHLGMSFTALIQFRCSSHFLMMMMLFNIYVK